MKQILLVDDERIVLESISKTVDWHSLGVSLLGLCKNAFEALEVIKKQHPDIVITDIKMPVMDGLELIHKVREFDSYVEFIILSGYGEFELAKKAMKEGVRHFLLKPCSEEEIREAVAGALKELSLRNGRNDDEDRKALLEPRSRDFTDMILDYVKKHYADESLNLKWIARELVFLNEDYVSKCFLKRTGSKFTSYLNQTRVEEARRLLDFSQATCETVARIVGYGNNPKYFAKVFKKYTGYTPSEYKNCRNDEKEGKEHDGSEIN